MADFINEINCKSDLTQTPAERKEADQVTKNDAQTAISNN